MAYVVIITMLALLQYLYFAVRVGGARGRFNIPAPAMSGNEEFERYVRVQQNTLEQLVIFLPALWAAATVGNPFYACAAGLLFIIGRGLYARVMCESQARTVGFVLTLVANLALIGAALWGAISQAF